MILESIGIPAEKPEALKAPFAQEAEFISYDKTFDIAFATQESMLRRAEIVSANLRAWLDGGQNNIIL